MATEQQVRKIASVLVEHQNGFVSLTNEDGQWVIQNTKEAVSLFAEAVKNRSKDKIEGYFRRLNLFATIPATVGKRTIAQAENLFTGYIDPDFKNWGLDVPSGARLETSVESLELAKDGTLGNYFTFLGDLNNRVMTDDQIIWVVENRPDLLVADGAGNFFLMKKADEFFVAYLYWQAGGLEIILHRLSNDDVWFAGICNRIITPQL
jgi:hypothetical protein